MRLFGACAIAMAACLSALPGNAKTTWTETVLTSFNGKANGAYPSGNLIADAAGNLYGTTLQGGNVKDCGGIGCGTVFILKPPAAGGKSWTETVLATFTGANGATPTASLIFDKAGNLYGATYAGGKSGDGTVFKLTRPAGGKKTWTQTLLFSFNGTDGKQPVRGLTFDKAGALYGATGYGGSSGDGLVFKLTPQAGGKTPWSEAVLSTFKGVNGSGPNGDLIFDAAGDLYGTTAGGGEKNFGIVFRLTHPAANKTAWTETVLTSFDGLYGQYPAAGVILDATGNLYGMTSLGGASIPCSSGLPAGCGTVFKLAPPSGKAAAWTETVIAGFSMTGAAGWYPQGGLIADRAGNLYATAYYGGKSNDGTVFKLAPPAGSKTAWTETILNIFTGANGAGPGASMTLDAAGNLYSTTQKGGAAGFGTVFKLTP